MRHAASDANGTPTALIVQAGKWRNVYQVHIKPCQDNVLPDKSIRLPSKADPDGGATLPDIAVSTGVADSLECLLHRIGVDDSEFVAGAARAGHVHIFSAQNDGGAGAAVTGGSPDPSQSLWDSLAHMMPYDLVLFSCEGAETNALTDSARTHLIDYLDNGGRAFMSHYHYAWFTPTGPFSTSSQPLATWATGARPDNDPVGAVVATTTADGGLFPEGVSMGRWLANVGATQDGGLYPIHDSHDNATVTQASTGTQVWLAGDDASASPGNAQYLSMDLPMGMDLSCGRVVYSELHAGGVQDDAGVGVDYAGSPSVRIVPSGCADRDLTPQEKALEFMVFNLSSCLVPRGQKPQTHPPM
jgi:hypothetical protein